MDHEKATQFRSKHNYFLVFLWGFVVGILVSSFVFISPVFAVLSIALSGAILIAEKIHKNKVSREIIFIVLAISSFGLGSLRYAIKDFHEFKVPSEIGIVLSEPERRDTDTRFVFLADNGEKVLVSTDMYSGVEYGDRIKIAGKLKQPGIIIQDDGREFDYGAYLAKDDIYYTMSFAKVEEIGETVLPALGQASGKSRSVMFRQFLFGIKNSFVGKMKQILTEPESSLLAGLIVAGKQALPGSILEEFKRAGVVHIVVLSGYNITVIAEFFLIILAFLPLKRRVLASGSAILLFVIMTGATATVVRAGIMAIVVLLGKVTHRTYSAPRALLLAGAIMLMGNPKLLVFDPSFQLTFLAMLALVYVEPIVSAHLSFITEKFSFRTLLATTIATQITVLPFLLYSVGSVSVVSLLSNILILMFVPITMLLGFIATLVSFASPVIALPLTFSAHIFLSWILGVAHILGNLSFASIEISHISAWLILIIYSGMIASVWRLRNFLRKTAS